MVEHFPNANFQLVPPSSLKPYARNPRTHSAKQIRQIAESIREFGFTNPVLVDRDGGVIAGHGRIEAAKLLGIERIPTIRLEQMTEAQKRAYVIADNKLAENARWDPALLAIEFRYLAELDLEFDLTVTGFETGEIDFLVQGDADRKFDKADEIPETAATAVTVLGDHWLLGRHHLLCADATSIHSFDRLLGDEKAQMVFTDPPYNVRIDGHVCGSGSIKHREFAMASGEMSEAEFTAFLLTVFENLKSSSVDGSMHFICMDWRHSFELLSAGRATYTELKNLCVWSKDNGGMGSLYRSKHELVFVFKKGENPHINNVLLGRHGRNRTNVWEYAGVNSMRAGRLDELAMHPTVKPVPLVADAILDCSRRGGMILDCFGGSGTSLIAAEKTGRRGYLIELDPIYIDVTIRRFQKLVGESAIHGDSGLTFDQVQEQRAEDAASSNLQDEEGKSGDR